MLAILQAMLLSNLLASKKEASRRSAPTLPGGKPGIKKGPPVGGPLSVAQDAAKLEARATEHRRLGGQQR